MRKLVVPNWSRYRTVIFDCDGVLLDSNGVKTDAFRVALQGEPPSKVDDFVDFHRANGGMNRALKFRRYFNQSGIEQGLTGKVEDACSRFATAARQGLSACAEVEGIRPFLEMVRALAVPTFVVSGASDDEVNAVLRQRGLADYFDEIRGAPPDKHEHLGELSDDGMLRGPGVFFGDARMDMEVAEAFGLDFVFIGEYSDWEEGRIECGERGHLVADNFTQLI